MEKTEAEQLSERGAAGLCSLAHVLGAGLGFTSRSFSRTFALTGLGDRASKGRRTRRSRMVGANRLSPLDPPAPSGASDQAFDSGPHSVLALREELLVGRRPSMSISMPAFRNPLRDAGAERHAAHDPSSSRRRQHLGQVFPSHSQHRTWYDAARGASRHGDLPLPSPPRSAGLPQRRLPKSGSLVRLCLKLGPERFNLASVTPSWINNAEQQRGFTPSTWHHEHQVAEGKTPLLQLLAATS